MGKAESEQELAQVALDVQNASNISGVAHSFAEAMRVLMRVARNNGYGTRWVNEHPVTKLFSDKIAHLSDTQTSGLMYQAYEDCQRLTAGRPKHYHMDPKPAKTAS